MFRAEFVKRVEEAEKRVKEGKARTFKDANESFTKEDHIFSKGFCLQKSLKEKVK